MLGQHENENWTPCKLASGRERKRYPSSNKRQHSFFTFASAFRNKRSEHICETWKLANDGEREQTPTRHISFFTFFTRFSLFSLSDCGNVFTVIRFFSLLLIVLGWLRITLCVWDCGALYVWESVGLQDRSNSTTRNSDRTTSNSSSHTRNNNDATTRNNGSTTRNWIDKHWCGELHRNIH